MKQPVMIERNQVTQAQIREDPAKWGIGAAGWAQDRPVDELSCIQNYLNYTNQMSETYGHISDYNILPINLGARQIGRYVRNIADHYASVELLNRLMPNAHIEFIKAYQRIQRQQGEDDLPFKPDYIMILPQAYVRKSESTLEKEAKGLDKESLKIAAYKSKNLNLEFLDNLMDNDKVIKDILEIQFNAYLFFKK
ncbi:MAG: hypothetical protein KAI26_04080 [Nanoarchaeota archaeon]|nr:hypothetical protein [Candidatus Omnitrophota bacterium]MCK5629769.1 hypothetical protein [Nanoarchaeota archaeon]